MFDLGLAVLGTLTSAVWFFATVSAPATLRRIEIFESWTPADPEPWPSVAVIVAACNEEATIGQALESLASQDYANLSVIVVEDRSTDQTRTVIQSVVERYPNVCLVAIDELPPGWLGKVHAMHRGAESAVADWLLFTDADVHFEAGALRRAVAGAVDKGLDHLTLIPIPRTQSFWLRVFQATFGSLMLRSIRAAKVGKDKRFYAGVGAFNMVRSSALSASPGLRYLSMEVVDDLALGKMLVESGAKTGLALTLRDVWLEWYAGVGEMIAGLEKNLYGILGRYSVWRATLMVGLLLLLALGPFLPLAQSEHAWAYACPIVAGVGLLYSAQFFCRAWGTRRVETLLAPIGFILLAIALARSAVVTTLRGGVTWRGTFYATKELRAGQRLRF